MKDASSDDEPQVVDVSSNEAPTRSKKAAGASKSKITRESKVAPMYGKVSLEVFE